MHVGFTAIARAGHVEIQIFGADRPGRPSLVTYAADGDDRAVLMGRLAYRGDLLGRLPTRVDPSLNDAALALQAYRQLGRAGIESLEGDFAVVVWDGRNRRLVASREVMGGFPIYWLQRNDLVVVSSGLRPLVDHLPEPTIDVDFLGEILMLPNFEIDCLEATAFEGVRRLVPGRSIAAEWRDGAAKVDLHEFWKWPDKAVDPGTTNVAELGERYESLLRRAVRERISGTTSAHFSGGMDSTSIALLARDELAKTGQPLHALSLVYRNLSNLDRETQYLEEALDRPGLTPHRIPADDLLDYDVFQNMPLHDEPVPGLQRIGLEMRLLKAAQDAGADTVLTGTGADEMLAMRPFQIADLLRRGRFWAAWSEACRWARAHNASVWSFLRPYGLNPLLPAWTQAGLRASLRKGFADWNRQNLWTIAPWVLPEFAGKAELRRKAMRNCRQAFRGAGSVVASEAMERVRSATGDWGRYHLAAPLGILSAHPFRDVRVFSFALGIRLHVRPDPGVQKPILAAAMKDVLPKSILERRAKTHYNSVYFAGISRNQEALAQMIQQSPAQQMGLFDREVLLRCLRQAALGVVSPHVTIGFDNTMSILKWLELLPKWRAQTPVPASKLIGGTDARGCTP